MTVNISAASSLAAAALCIAALGFAAGAPRASAQTAPYSQLDPKPYDPAVDAHIDMYISSWRESMPVKSHGALVERSILTPGDPTAPKTRGAVLKYVSRFVRASLGAGETTSPTTLSGEQEIFYILSGRGEIAGKTARVELKPGVAALVPPGIPFTMTNTGEATLTMFLLAEPVPQGFEAQKDIVVADENTLPWNLANPHWTGLSKILFTPKNGLATVQSVLSVQFDPMTFFQPHSHREGAEEVWTAITDNCYFLLGKQIRSQPPGTAYYIPPDGKTPHANFNVSDDRVKLFYFSRLNNPEIKK